MSAKISRLALSIVLIFSLLIPAFAQEPITLVPFNDPAFGVEGVIPEGWAKLNPGLYARQNAATDVTLLGVQSATGMDAETLLTALMPQLGLSELPTASGETVTEFATWNDYVIDVPLPNGSTIAVRLSVTESEGTAYLVLLQATPDEIDALAESVYAPVRDALRVVVEEPVEVPYVIEDVTFENGDITLAGTLTLPETEGPHPAVVLMTGSGPQTRDEIVVPGFPIFGIIADHLTRNGIAVLRYDDRGVGESTGEYSETTLQDFASDGKAAVAYLATREDINTEEIGLLGHSEGGVYSAILGADPDSGVAFIVSMAGTAVSGMDVLTLQNELILAARGANEAQIAAQLAFLEAVYPAAIAQDWDTVSQLTYKTTMAQYEMATDEEKAQIGDPEAYAQQAADNFVAGYANVWFPSFLEYDPGVDWAQTTVPVLGVFGGLDLQVDAGQNAAPLAEALEAAGNADFEIVTLPDANHLFQSATTGGIEEYGTLPPEFTPDFLPTVTDWILARVTVAE